MNNQARSCKLKCEYNIQGICYAYGECIAKDLFIEELEKIKAEIIACTQQEEGEVPACINYGIKLSTEIVEKHISELKGENK